MEKNHQANQSNMNYRTDIDGLRALAVVAVIVNHFNENWLTGGYLGVDIFFVITDFVITLSLDQKKYTSFASFLGNFWRKDLRG